MLDNKWYKFDDSHVAPLEGGGKSAVDAAAYVLFYHRRKQTEETPVGIRERGAKVKGIVARNRVPKQVPEEWAQKEAEEALEKMAEVQRKQEEQKRKKAAAAETPAK